MPATTRQYIKALSRRGRQAFDCGGDEFAVENERIVLGLHPNRERFSMDRELGPSFCTWGIVSKTSGIPLTQAEMVACTSGR